MESGCLFTCEKDLEVNSMLDFETASTFDCSYDVDFCSLGPDWVHEIEESFEVLSIQEGRALSQLTDLTRGEAVSPRCANLRLTGCLLYSNKELILLTD